MLRQELIPKTETYIPCQMRHSFAGMFCESGAFNHATKHDTTAFHLTAALRPDFAVLFDGARREGQGQASHS